MTTNRTSKKWSKTEDARLVRQVKAFPQNLSKCFILVAEEIGRTKGAVANHWYTKVSKDPEVIAFFTASAHHVSKNRKNGEGETINHSIWLKFIKILKKLKL